MPHITVTGCNMNLQIKQIDIHAKIDFAKETFITPKADLKLNEFQQKLEALVGEYFDIADISSDKYSNHEYNSRMYNY